MITCIDPGNVSSAMLVMDGQQIHRRYYEENHVIRELLRNIVIERRRDDHMAIEMIASFGMAVGESVFETVLWIGRFIEVWGGDQFSKVKRMEVKTAICHNSRAKDANIRQALIDLYGGPLSVKKGGPLHGISGDMWSALAVGITYQRRPRV
jgi:hypothetical protein